MPAPSPRAAVLHVEAGSLTGEVPVRIYAQPPHLQIQPQAAALPPGGMLQLTARCLDERGRPLFIEGVPMRWSCPPELGQVDAAGLFHASATAAQGQVTVEVAGARAAVPVVVGTETRLLDGFEVAGRWTGSTVPATLKAALSVADDEPHEGQRSLKLDYDFTVDHSTRAVYANTHLPLGQPLALRLWVRGDGGGAWLRARLRDARGQAQVVDFSRSLGKLDDWRRADRLHPRHAAAARSPSKPSTWSSRTPTPSPKAPSSWMPSQGITRRPSARVAIRQAPRRHHSRRARCIKAAAHKGRGVSAMSSYVECGSKRCLGECLRATEVTATKAPSPPSRTPESTQVDLVPWLPWF